MDFPDVTATLQWTGSQNDARYLWALHGREETQTQTQTQTQAHVQSGSQHCALASQHQPPNAQPSQPAQDMGKSDADKTNCDLTL